QSFAKTGSDVSLLTQPHALSLGRGQERSGFANFSEAAENSREIVHKLRSAYSLAPLIHSRIVAYSGESLVNRMPPPCDRVADPATPSVSELDVGLRNIRLFSGSAWSTTFNAVENVPLNSVCVEWQCTQAYPSRPRL